MEISSENESFRRFNYRSGEKVYKEFMLYAIGRNIMKYHRFLHHEIETYEGKNGQLSRRCASKIQTRGFCPKIEAVKEETIPERNPFKKAWILWDCLLTGCQRLKIGIN